MTQASPRVSVGMPVYNGERHLREALESILHQTYTDIELVISDNASTDRTGEICGEFAAKDSRVRYSRNPVNIGIPGNYNIVFRRSRGVYFKWASSNDFCDPRLVESCVHVLDERPDVVLAYARTRLVRSATGSVEDYEDGLNLPQERACDRFRAFYDRVYLNNVMNGVMRADILRRTSLIDPYLGSDVVLMGELTLYGKFAEVPEFLFYRRMDRHSATALQSRAEVVRQYDPAQRSRMLLQRWKGHRGSWLAVLKAPLSLGEKACLGRFLWRRLLRDRGYLAQELRDAARVWRWRAGVDEVRAGGS